MNKFKVLLLAGFTAVSAVPAAEAFPLLCSDPSRLAASLRVSMQDAQIIYTEVMSNYAIIKEIQNGGFASAGAAVFGKIQNGDYDRFGNSLASSLKEGKSMSDNVAKRENKVAEEVAERNAKTAAALKEAKAESDAATEAAKNERGKNAFSNAYNWLKNNRSFTSGASNALNGISNGDWGSALSGAAGATGSALGGSAGDIVSGASDNAGNALDNILRGDYGNAAGELAGGTGDALGGTAGAVVSSGGTMAAGVTDSIGRGGGVMDMGRGIGSSVAGAAETVGDAAKREEAARKAAEEAAKKKSDEANKKAAESVNEVAKMFCNNCLKDHPKEIDACKTACAGVKK